MYTNACSLSCGSSYCFSPGSGRACSNSRPASCYSPVYSAVCQPSCCARYRTSYVCYCDSGRVTDGFRYGRDKSGYSPASCRIRGSRSGSGSGVCGYSVCSACGRSSSSRCSVSCGHRSSCKSHCGSGSNRSSEGTPTRRPGYTTSSLSRIVFNRVTPQEMHDFWGEDNTKRNATIGCGSSSDSRGCSCSRGSCTSTLLTRPVGENSSTGTRPVGENSSTETRPVGENSSTETRPRGIGGRDSTLSCECGRPKAVSTAARSACQMTRGSGGSHRTDQRTDQRSDQRSDQPSVRSSCGTGTCRRL